MSFVDIERPAKKRRFFVEQSPIAEQSFGAESGPNPKTSHLPNTALATEGNDPSITLNGFHDDGDDIHKIPVSGGGNEDEHIHDGSQDFDASLLESVVGEKLSPETTRRLRKAAGGDLERGRCSPWNEPFLASLLTCCFSDQLLS